MDFKECLVQQRKARGFSQEELAAQIGVSRQAVSKWETGEASPDLPKLIALAETLTISMDALCGRGVSPAAPSAEKVSSPKKSRVLRHVAYLALMLFLMAGSFFAGTQFPDTSQPEETPIPALPETFSVSGVQFFAEHDSLSYQFVPSISGETYTYQITFSGYGSTPKTFTASYSNGVCTGTAALSAYDTYSVAVVVSNGQDSRAAALATGLTFGNNHVQWTPIE